MTSDSRVHEEPHGDDGVNRNGEVNGGEVNGDGEAFDDAGDSGDAGEVDVPPGSPAVPSSRKSLGAKASESTFVAATRDRVKRRRRASVIVFLVGFSGIFFLGATSGKSSIEKRIRTNAERSLKGSDFTGVQVSVNGDRVSLSGAVASQQQADDARKLVKNLNLVRSVDSSKLVVRSSGGAGVLPLHAIYNEGALTFEGVSPGASAERVLFVGARRGLGDSKVVNQLTPSASGGVNADVAAYEALGLAFGRFPGWGVRRADVNVSEQGMTISGVLADESNRDSLISTLEAAVAPVKVTDLLTTENGVGTPNSTVGSTGSTVAGETATSTSLGAAVPGDPALVGAKQIELNALLANSRIEFATDSAALTPAAKKIIADVSNLVGALAVNIEVGGHTDSRGKAERNQALSQRRADAVRDELVRLGVPENRVTAIGFGSTKLLAPDTSPRGNPKNRRIEIILK